jgi:hypothetical protein
MPSTVVRHPMLTVGKATFGRRMALRKASEEPRDSTRRGRHQVGAAAP